MTDQRDRAPINWETRWGWWMDEESLFPLWIDLCQRLPGEPNELPDLREDLKALGKWLISIFRRPGVGPK